MIAEAVVTEAQKPPTVRVPPPREEWFPNVPDEIPDYHADDDQDGLDVDDQVDVHDLVHGLDHDLDVARERAVGVARVLLRAAAKLVGDKFRLFRLDFPPTGIAHGT